MKVVLQIARGFARRIPLKLFPSVALATASAVAVTVALTIVLGPAASNDVPDSGPGGGDVPLSGRGGGNIVHIGPPLPSPEPKVGRGIAIEQDSKPIPGTDTKSMSLPLETDRLRIRTADMPEHEAKPLPPPETGVQVKRTYAKEITLPEECAKSELALSISPPADLKPLGVCYINVNEWDNGTETEFSYFESYERREPTHASLIVARFRLAPGDTIDIVAPHTEEGDPVGVLSRQTVTKIRGTSVVIEQSTPDGQVYDLDFAVGDFGYHLGSLNVDLDSVIALAESIVTEAQQGR